MGFLRNASIRAKLSLVLGMALALVVGVGLLGVLQLRSVNNVTKELRTVWLPRIEALDQIKRSASEHRLLAARRMQTTNFRYLAEIIKGMDAARKTLREAEASFEPMISSASERLLFQDFQSLWHDYEDTFRIVLQRLEDGGVSSALADFNSVSTSAFEHASEKLDALVASAKEQSARSAEKAEDVYRLAIVLNGLVIALSVLLAAMAIAWTSHNITSPLVRVTEAMQRLSSGDHSVVLSGGYERKDEIGVLVEAAAGYRESLVSNIRLAAEAEGRERLQAAVRAMPIGLCMFDKGGRLIICNERYAQMYDLPAELARTGAAMRDILAHREKSGIRGTTHNQFLDELLDAINDGVPSRHIVQFRSGQTLSITNQPMENGGVVGIHEDITDRRRAEAQIRHMARHDALTDLPNRVLFKERVEIALERVRRGEKVAMLCIDLDRFKAVNDTLGHPVGDALLKAVAERLSRCVRETDTVARLGGDEFAIVQVGVELPIGATVLAQRIIETLSAPYTIEGHHIIVGTSVGIAIAPQDSDDPDQLLKSADMALYRAKADGRGRYRFFEAEMDKRMQARRGLELDLREALSLGGLEVFYQPVVSLKTNTVSSFEALLRWRHPHRGMVSPAEFIPIAEETGLIGEMGAWVLKQACSDAMTWPSNIKVAVNLSPVQFRRGLVLDVLAALGHSGLPGHRLELEITETVLLQDEESTFSTLSHLRDLGASISMDDFGTGYSSLSYLRKFPFDKIKIDQSFIRDLPNRADTLAIVRTIMGLGVSLGMTTTAEGVETTHQLDQLRLEGCDEAQGYLFSPARPAHEIPKLLSTLAEGVAAVAA
jgi:diguanylate cyclase (GGDEF)-like protein